MTPLAKLSGTLSIALPPVVSAPLPAAAQAERMPIVAGGLTGSCSTQTSVSVTAAVTPGHSIADSGAMSEWLSAMVRKPSFSRSLIPASSPLMGRITRICPAGCWSSSEACERTTDALAVALVDGSVTGRSPRTLNVSKFRSDNGLVDTPMLVGADGMRSDAGA